MRREEKKESSPSTLSARQGREMDAYGRGREGKEGTALSPRPSCLAGAPEELRVLVG